MRTAGIDLASQDVHTGLAVLAWVAGAATVERLDVGVDDAALAGAIEDVDKAGIDCPLGWPVAFAEFVHAQATGPAAPPPDWRTTLTARLTDRVTRQVTGLVPLSVSADRIAYPAVRCAGVLAALAARGVDVDRSGSGRVVEVYPAAALSVWGLPYRGYKGTARLAALGALVDALLVRAPWLDLGRFEAACRRSDHAFDAVVSALVARAAATGKVTSPEPGRRSLARAEGWIALPGVPLTDLS